MMVRFDDREANHSEEPGGDVSLSVEGRLLYEVSHIQNSDVSHPPWPYRIGVSIQSDSGQALCELSNTTFYPP